MVPPPKLYRIAEIVQYAKVSRQTIHNYTTFGLITEVERMANCNYRLYGEDVFQRLARIQQLRAEGVKLSRIREMLQEEDAAKVAQPVESR